MAGTHSFILLIADTRGVTYDKDGNVVLQYESIKSTQVCFGLASYFYETSNDTTQDGVAMQVVSKGAR